MKLAGFSVDACRAFCVGLVLTTVASSLTSRAVAADNFPLNEELLLDTRPMPGSKRIPMLDIRADGAVLIDLWCNQVQGQFVVAGDTVTLLTGQRTNQSCTPERERGDQELLSALEQVTNWRREGDALVLVGPRSLRFHRATN